jgi:polysaccharide biosynthesis/export protein
MSGLPHRSVGSVKLLNPVGQRGRHYEVEVTVIECWRVTSILFLTMTGFLFAGCTQVGPSPDATGPDASAPTTFSQSDYVIGAADTLDVFVYRSPDLSMAGLAVRPDGRISLPLVEDITAAGKTPTALAREIEGRLKKYIQDPTVTVIVRGFVGPYDRQIRVIGEAAEPRSIPYRDHMTLLDVVIETKGLTKFASGNSAIIVRRYGTSDQKSIPVHLSDLIKNGDISQNIEMQPGDTLIIPASWF